ncbi:transcriptional regulator, LysR family protein [Stappia aggregata IAM 12614]|uniref:Transcriptional regulator, LysR family protein n=1 Tax=Roseibium aggregatum (strain ATCC 25650 / DSM 13394 / JCM 20685 / NBRC 16684 / NCIMB 2208 / IAM 12614 / B1) TaxID=384765 RepID=A0NQL9_ROSAI|nr:LysR family transcriptional regulator [Roseibium aggregatum]EAV45077.1 transcriptional regulator, LysR family protein [Stappia aggregata IAM 12614] [Roseibium aggregatum IAM 12614]
MNWDDLKLVDAAARMRSLSGAAKALDISQPQLSRRLKSFEDRIGARLFDRTPTGLKPTDAGLRLIPLAEDMRKKAEAAARILPDLSGSALKVVRVAVDEVRARVLTDRFDLLTRLLDGVELELISSHQHVNHQSRSIELQIRNCLPETDTLIARKIGELAYAVYGSADYVANHPAARTVDRYKLCAWLGFAPDDLWYPSQMRWLETRLPQMPTLRSNTMTTLMNMTASGAGLCLLPVFMGDNNRDLVRLTEPLPELTNVEHIIVHRDLRREPAVRKAMDAIAEVFHQMGPQLRGAQLDKPVAAAE